jgi:indole-3-glycerol phosphate synthase
MNILDQIIAHKRLEVAERKKLQPAGTLELAPGFSRPIFSLTDFVRKRDRTGIIAEFKRKSPSKGVINANASVEETTAGYVQAGASALSVLTDRDFFGGSDDDLRAARKANACPILRKDFTIDEYQITEARTMGADAILLIAAVLTPSRSVQLADFAHSVGLEVLLEVHNEEELKAHSKVSADLIGVNNRNLKNFEVSIEISKRLSALIPQGKVKVSESGISDPATIVELRKYGYEGFLMGENFMKHSRPNLAAAAFMEELRKLQEVKR